MRPDLQAPDLPHYDVVIVGGAMMGSSVAWFLSDLDDFDGSVLVIERDPTYSACSTAHTNGCIRQQFSTALNVRISQFGAEFITSLRARMGDDPAVPEARIQNFGYLYLADTEDKARVLRENAAVQHGAGAATRLLTRDEIAAEYPFYALDDILLGSINTRDEGYWDHAAVFDAWRRQARARGVTFLHNEVVGMTLNPAGGRVDSLTLASGDIVGCGQVVNAAGPRAARVAAMAGLDVPVEPRKRYTWMIRAKNPLDRPLPLTIDPTGIHIREVGGGIYQAGGHPDPDPAVDYDDFAMDHGYWQDKAWPVIAARIPQFEAVKVVADWAGHYAMNVFDHNAILGPHPEVGNFLLLNGFSGHGLQQSPAMGRGMAEWLTFGAYRSLDLSPFHYDRIARGARIVERAII